MCFGNQEISDEKIERAVPVTPWRFVGRRLYLTMRAITDSWRLLLDTGQTHIHIDTDSIWKTHFQIENGDTLSTG
jgi:hypothetical protein